MLVHRAMIKRTRDCHRRDYHRPIAPFLDGNSSRQSFLLCRAGPDRPRPASPSQPEITRARSRKMHRPVTSPARTCLRFHFGVNTRDRSLLLTLCGCLSHPVLLSARQKPRSDQTRERCDDRFAGKEEEEGGLPSTTTRPFGWRLAAWYRLASCGSR